MGSTDTTKRIVWWGMSIIAALVILGSAGWAASINGGLSKLQATAATHGERIAIEEIRSEEMRDRLIRMEQKLDRLLEQRAK